MDIYSSTHPGIDQSQSQISNVVNSDNLQGYFNRGALEMLIGQVDAVGIRFYQADENDDGSRQMIAIGVKKDGFEVDNATAQNYLICSNVDNNTPLANGPKTLDRASAKLSVENAEKKDLLLPPNESRGLGFASYFSSQMIKDLLASKGGVPVWGIQLYVTNMTTFDPRLKTHLAVSVIENNGQLTTLASSQAGEKSHILSDQPCPGHCVSFDKTTNDKSLQPFTTNINSPYLVAW